MAYQNTLKSFITFLIIFVSFHQNVFGVVSQTTALTISLNDSMNEISKVSKDFAPNGTISQTIEKMDINLEPHLESCREFIDLAWYNLNDSLAITNNLTTLESRENVKTWVSAAEADLETCIYSFEYAPSEATKIVTDNLNNATRLICNCLDIIYQSDNDSKRNDRSTRVTRDQWPPSWLSSRDRTLLENPQKLIQANIIVARDGSGNYKTIGEAIKAVPSYSRSRFVIYVKKGVYFENVVVDRTKWNVMIFGDGMSQTVISGSRNNASNVPTVATATFSVYGYGFIARDMGLSNTAGPTRRQAVALVTTSDQSVYYRCRIDGYQDTLFAHSMRQFYRECKIYGTIDFIFGFAAALFQKSSILVKRPLPGQFNTITANGKSSPNGASGFSIQNCYIVPAEDLSGVRTYLGRPWKSYSTTIFMESVMGSLIDRVGWHPWIENVTPPDTIYYAEYANTGPGADITGRVGWRGLRANVSRYEASKFTVRSLIGGDKWIPATGVPFIPDL